MATMMSQFESEMASAAARRRILWVDGVGGYLLEGRDEVTLGQAIAGSSADIGIVGDIRREQVLFAGLGQTTYSNRCKPPSSTDRRSSELSC